MHFTMPICFDCRPPAARSSSLKSAAELPAAEEAIGAAPAPAPVPVLAVPFVPPPPRGAAREASGLTGGQPGPGPAEPSTVADPFAFSGAAGVSMLVMLLCMGTMGRAM